MELPPGLTRWGEAVSEAKYDVRSNSANKVLERSCADAEGRAGSAVGATEGLPRKLTFEQRPERSFLKHLTRLWS